MKAGEWAIVPSLSSDCCVQSKHQWHGPCVSNVTEQLCVLPQHSVACCSLAFLLIGSSDMYASISCHERALLWPDADST